MRKTWLNNIVAVSMAVGRPFKGTSQQALENWLIATKIVLKPPESRNQLPCGTKAGREQARVPDVQWGAVGSSGTGHKWHMTLHNPPHPGTGRATRTNSE